MEEVGLCGSLSRLNIPGTQVLLIKIRKHFKETVLEI